MKEVHKITYQGHCHCGSIRFQFDSHPIVCGLRCNCSICRRKGTLLTDFTLLPQNIKINVCDDRLNSYQFGSNIAKHQFCSHCGISPFVQTRLNPGEYRVNLGCIENLNVFTLAEKNYDGESL